MLQYNSARPSLLWRHRTNALLNLKLQPSCCFSLEQQIIIDACYFVHQYKATTKRNNINPQQNKFG